MPCAGKNKKRGLAALRRITTKKGLPFLGNLGAPEGPPLPALFPTVRRTVGTGRDAERPDELFESLPGQTGCLPKDNNKKGFPFLGNLGAPEGTRTPDLLIRSQTGHLNLNTLPYKI